MLETAKDLRAFLKKVLPENWMEDPEYKILGIFTSATLEYLDKLEGYVASMEREVARQAAQQKNILDALRIVGGKLDLNEAPGQPEGGAPPVGAGPPPANFPAGFSPGQPVAGGQSAPAAAPSAPIVDAEVITKDNIPKPDVTSTKATNVHPIPKQGKTAVVQNGPNPKVSA